MRVRILGTAAGGGVPQWNCACGGCATARDDPARRRRHASLAVQGGAGWWVVNATPDVTEQIEATADLRPHAGTRRSPVAGVILTDAELDHTLGLPRLREAASLRVAATRTVRGALSAGLRLDAVLAPYTDLTWTELDDGPVRLDGGLEVQAVPVSARRPRYAADLDVPGDSWVVALRVTSGGRSLLYAPCLAAWPAELDAAVRDADCAVLDGTFWDDDEPRRAGISRRTATEMGHLPINGPGGTAERVAALSGPHVLYTHLNNTNPLADRDGDEHQALAAMGLGVAAERTAIEL
jgi:pyrroloquinoline quinone biosynthesis protein B